MADAALLGQPSPGSSLAALDYTNEDFNRDEKIQAMGFVGEHSEIAWMYRLKRLLERSNSASPRETWDRHSVSSVNFFLDDSDIPVIDDVDPSQRPPITVADQLVDSYFQAVHPTFPIVGKMIFLAQYKSFYSAPHVRPGKRWLAILNLIFAIAAKHARHLYNDVENGTDESLVYFSRAWKLSMNDTALLEHPNLQQVQVEGLTSFYLMSIGQVNRYAPSVITSPYVSAPIPLWLPAFPASFSDLINPPSQVLENLWYIHPFGCHDGAELEKREQCDCSCVQGDALSGMVVPIYAG